MVERKKSDSFSSKWMAEKEISHSLSLKIAELQRDQYSHQAEIQTLKQSLVEVKNQARGDNSSFREDIEQKLEQQREISTRLHSEIQSLRKEKEELKVEVNFPMHIWFELSLRIDHEREVQKANLARD